MDFASALGKRTGLAAAMRSSGALSLPTEIVPDDYFEFAGGLNEMQAPMKVPPGRLLGCLNYEPGVLSGYRRFDGYERFDGHPSPSDADYVAITLVAALDADIGDTVTESGSGATGTIAYIDDDNLALVILPSTDTKFVGAGSTLTSGTETAVTKIAFANTAPTDALADSYWRQKWLYLQDAIGPVGGSASSGPVRMVWPHADDVFAIRDNDGATAADLWKATDTGWTKVDPGIKVKYTGGVYSADMLPPAEGTVLYGDTSGASFTVRRVATQTGTWGTDAAGYLITDAISGTPEADETFSTSDDTAILTYVSHATQVIPAGGTYHVRSWNFRASEDADTGYRIYMTNGVGNAMEYDAVDDVLVLIETGMDPDTPTHLEIHADYLFLGYTGGSLQNSGYQLPLNWNVVFGADSRSVGADISFMREDVDNTLVVGTRRKIWKLTGSQVELFQLKVYAANTGSIENTDEIPGQMIFMEDRGITTLKAAQLYGNFKAGSLTNEILDTIENLIATDTAIGAVVTRRKNLYRLVFASGDILCIGTNAAGSFSGWTRGLFVDPPSCFFGAFYEAPNGKTIERAFFGGTDGYVYEIDKGRSFDGEDVQHFLRMSYWNSRRPDLFKRYRRLQVDLSPEGTSALSLSVDYNYGNRSGQVAEPLDFVGNGGYWDVSLWDQFVWDSAKYTQAIMKVEGEGYNIGITIAGKGNNDMPVTLYGASLQWSRRVINRNTRDA